ncbi:MAG: GHKL domain-containing protein [Peptococcaceae bacterium]|nr:GHKL domain-containing protein [Peptococcaceae bacterium]
MLAFDIVETLMPFMEALMFFLIFEAFLNRRPGWGVWRYVLGVVVLGFLIMLSNHLFLYTFKNFILILLLAMIIAVVCYEGSFLVKVFALFIETIISSVSEVAVMNIMASILVCSVTDIVTVPVYRFVGILLSKFTALAVCNGIRVKRRMHRIHLNTAYWIIYTVLFGIVSMVIFFIFRMGYELNNTYYNTFATVSAVGMTFCTVLVLYLYERQAEQSAQLRMREQYERHLKSQVKHLDEILLKQEELRRVRHDMNNQLVAIQGYFHEGDIAGGEAYVTSLLQNLQTPSSRIRTGNSALDAILSTKKALAESKGITVDMEVQISDQLPLEPVDVCVIFGNALDNAIEACDRITQGEKKINLVLVQREGKLLCHLTNTAPINSSKDFSITSKSDKKNHGFGLVNLRESLEKYDCEPTITYKDGQFSLKFVVYEK